MERLFYRLFSSPHEGGGAPGSSPRPRRPSVVSSSASSLPARSEGSQSADRSDFTDHQCAELRSTTTPREVSSQDRLSVWCERHLTVGRWEKEVAECSQRLKDSRRKEPEQLAQVYAVRGKRCTLPEVEFSAHPSFIFVHVVAMLSSSSVEAVGAVGAGRGRLQQSPRASRARGRRHRRQL